MSPAAEWNIMVDPEAAKIVFESGVDLVMIPIEVSHTALVTEEIIKRISMMNSQFSELLVDLLLYFKQTYKDVFKFDNPPLHDPLAVAYVIDPTLFKTELMRVDIETMSPLCRGRTLCDIYHMSYAPKNVNVALSVNVTKFWDLLLDALALANAKSPYLKKVIL